MPKTSETVMAVSSKEIDPLRNRYSDESSKNETSVAVFLESNIDFSAASSI